jgi:GNAT superfamily N-acetyltransferase
MICKCSEQDFSQINEVINDGALAYKGIIPSDRWHEPYMTEAELKQQINEGVQFWCYRQGKEIVGVMGIQFKGDVTLIRHAYVRTKNRKQGIGSKLLDHLASIATTPVLIGTWADARWAIDFYQKHGYRLISEEEKNEVLPKYWKIPSRQIQTSVVLASANWNYARQKFTVRNAKPGEFQLIGKLMVNVYSQLEGFPKQEEQPDYYHMLYNIGEVTGKPGAELLVAVASNDQIVGAVVYFADMQYYGSGGTAIREKNAAGFRLLAVDAFARGQGIGKLLTLACIQKAKSDRRSELIIHSTKAMQRAWKMYEGIGFKRSEDLDFMQADLPVFGFRLKL